MSSYNRMPMGQKRTHATAQQREPSITCPRCSVQLMPVDLVAHLDERCTRALPEPHPTARWIKRERVIHRYAASSSLTRWLALGLIRTNADGLLLERDVAIVAAWAQALGVL